MNFGKAISEARSKARLSQADLAEKLGVSAGTVAGWELGEARGGHGFRLDKLTKIAEALGISVSELIKKAS